MMQDHKRSEFTPAPANYLEIAGHALAAFGISLRIEQLLQLPGVGITIMLVPIAAQNYGAGKNNWVRQAFKRCWTLGFFATACAFPFLWHGGEDTGDLSTFLRSNIFLTRRALIRQFALISEHRYGTVVSNDAQLCCGSEASLARA
jgi:hypothetical protein